MSAVELRTVANDEAELRLDRWFRRHFPQLAHGHLQKLLRTGQIRVDGARVRGDARLAPGQVVRVPPLHAAEAGPERGEPVAPHPADAGLIRSLILHEDDALIVLNKPPGLAVQGGSGTHRHIDAMLPALARGSERPRLVHRLDRDTSGLLVVARTAAAAAKLTDAFRRHRVDKLYWAIVVGRPPQPAGRITQKLSKRMSPQGERIEADESGQSALTEYRTIARAGRIATWLSLRPLTGRTHQLRVHCAGLGVPILGDRKYGGAWARLAGAPPGLMLHARELRLPHPDGGTLACAAPPSEVLRAGLAWLGLEIHAGLPNSQLANLAAT